MTKDSTVLREVSLPREHELVARDAGRELLAALESSTIFGQLPCTVLPVLMKSFRPDDTRVNYRKTPFAPSPKRFYLITAGRLKTFRVHPETGREITLSLLGPGDVFSVINLLTGAPTEDTIQALPGSPVETASVTTELMHHWRAMHPELDRALMTYIANELRGFTDLACELTLNHAEVRLARLLVRLSTSNPPHGSKGVVAGLSHEILAGLIGSSREGVTRSLQILKDEGVISVGRRRLTVLDLDALIERCQESAWRPTTHRDSQRTAPSVHVFTP